MADYWEYDGMKIELTGVFADPQKTYLCSICGEECKGGFIHGKCAKAVINTNITTSDFKP